MTVTHNSPLKLLLLKPLLFGLFLDALHLNVTSSSIGINLLFQIHQVRLGLVSDDLRVIVQHLQFLQLLLQSARNEQNTCARNVRAIVIIYLVCL